MNSLLKKLNISAEQQKILLGSPVRDGELVFDPVGTEQIIGIKTSKNVGQDYIIEVHWYSLTTEAVNNITGIITNILKKQNPAVQMTKEMKKIVKTLVSYKLANEDSRNLISILDVFMLLVPPPPSTTNIFGLPKDLDLTKSQGGSGGGFGIVFVLLFVGLLFSKK